MMWLNVNSLLPGKQSLHITKRLGTKYQGDAPAEQYKKHQYSISITTHSTVDQR